MGLLDIERDRLKKHYLELDDNYYVLKGETEESLKSLTKTEIKIIEKFGPFVDLYTKINCSPDFYEMDGFDTKKVTLNLHDLKEISNRVITISEYIKESDSKQYAAISLLGTKNLLEKADELNIGHGSKIKHEQLNELKNALGELYSKLLEKDLQDKNLKVNLQDDEKILDFEKRMHEAIKDLKKLNHNLSTIKSVCDKYNEKLKYLAEIYEHDREILREYIDFTDVKNWKVLDKNQDALMAIHSNVTVAQLLHDMCSKGIIDKNGEEIDYKTFEKMIERADDVIDVIDVYLKVNVF